MHQENNLHMWEQSERLLSSIVESSPDAIISTDRGGKITSWNRSAGEMFGYSSDEILGKPIWRLIPSDRHDEEERIIKRLIAGERIEHYETIRVTKDGQYIPVTLSVGPIRDSTGALVGISKIVHGIAIQKAVEQALHESRSILRLVLDTIPHAVFWKDRNSVYLGCNQVASRTLGFESPVDLVGKTDFDFPTVSRPQAESFVALDRHVMESGVPHPPIVEPLTRHDGVTIWLETIKVPLYDAGGRVIGILGTWHDITERQQTLEVSRRSEARYRSLATAMSEIVWTSNADGRGLQSTPPLDEYTGLSRETIRGSGWRQAIHPDDRQAAATAWSDALAAGCPYKCELRLRRADGQWRHLVSRGIPIQNPAGIIEEWIGVAIDVTVQRLAEQDVRAMNLELEQRVRSRTAELEVANKELEAFSYSVSHDLRAPLRAIDGYSRILMLEHADDLPTEVQDFLRDIRANTQLMGNLINDLLQFSRLSRQPIEKRLVDPNEIVAACVRDLEKMRASRDIEITINPLGKCLADPALLKQVWMNLLSNALKYSSAKEKSVIEIGQFSGIDSGGPGYYVKDNGVGFDMRYVHKLFGVFQRLHRQEEFEGTGVGLAIVQRIIHRHGGRVWAIGAPNQGAAFHFTLLDQGPSS